jgi:hypothetical protein
MMPPSEASEVEVARDPSQRGEVEHGHVPDRAADDPLAVEAPEHAYGRLDARPRSFRERAARDPGVAVAGGAQKLAGESAGGA